MNNQNKENCNINETIGENTVVKDGIVFSKDILIDKEIDL